MKPTSDLHAAARDLARAGFAVFPAGPDDPTIADPVARAKAAKRPACEHGFHDATTDLAVIDAWWTAQPRLNVAIDLASLGCWVLDSDPKNGGDATLDGLILANGPLPATRVVRTPSGGLHHYFAGPPFPPQTAGSRLGAGLDTRTPGKGYVLIPPSVVNGAPYALIDPTPPAELAADHWLRQLLDAPQRAAAKAATDLLDQPQNVARAARLLRDYVARGHVAVDGAGGDTRTFAVACEVLNLGLSDERALKLIAAEWNPSCVPPWDEDELRVKVENAARYAQNEAGAWATGTSEQAFGAALGELPDDAAPAATYPPPMSAAEVARGTFPPVEYAVDKLVVRAVVNLLYGDGGAGKTMLALNLAVAVALGLPFLGLNVQQMPVLLALAEDDYGPVKARLEAICAVFGCDLASLPIRVWCLPGHDLRIAQVADDGSWIPGPFLEPLKAELARLGRRALLILDTASDFASLNENLRLPVNTLCKVVLAGLCRAFDATVLVNAHPSKAAMADGTHYAGSTAWNNAVRNRLSLTKQGDGTNPKRILRVEKTNYGQGHEWELFQLGMSFATELEREGGDQQSRLMEACITTAVAAAETAQPIQNRGKLAPWIKDEIETAVGFRPSDREVREQLFLASRQSRIRYLKSTRHRDAGYYPFDMARAAELANEARRLHRNAAEADHD